MLSGYDLWKTQLPEESEPQAICDRCGAELYEGDFLYTVNEEKLCEDCLNDDYRRRL